jgi:hypothetical protein
MTMLHYLSALARIVIKFIFDEIAEISLFQIRMHPRLNLLAVSKLDRCCCFARVSCLFGRDPNVIIPSSHEERAFLP